MNKKTLKAKITSALRKGIKGSRSSISNLVPAEFTAGKIYEAYVLGLVCQRLKSFEGLQFTLVGSTKITLKSSPGPINPAYPHVRVSRSGVHMANVWTDIEFTSLSAAQRGTSPLSQGDYHEMDIGLVHPNCQRRPHPEEIILAVECKNTGYQKSLLREILGIRRELSFLDGVRPTAFDFWPRPMVPANPPSCIAVFSTDASIANYQAPGNFFGIDFFHEPM